MSLVIQPSSTAQWYTLVNEAEYTCSLQLGEELESYLVFLLMRFAGKPELIASIVALEFLHSVEAKGRYRWDLLKEVGDKCLLFSGLFPGLAQKRRVKESYFIDLGQNSYYALANLTDKILIAKTYNLLCEHFTSVCEVMHSMRSDASKRHQMKNFKLIEDNATKRH